MNERLDHLGVVAGVCEEIGLAAYLDRLAGETNHHVSMGTATVVMILNGLGFSKCTFHFFREDYLQNVLQEQGSISLECFEYRTL